ncbi:FAD-dependent oxidoreductase [Streptomyces globosus]|uniref:FAD-dependent oxidoreductase n=1 Tax=Streptomyces globosus TaxID=68209 RepID=UPI0037F691CD
MTTTNAPAATDVLVVGSGPTGLALACDLARRGIAVRVVEQRPAPHRESRGKGLQPEAMELLDGLGAGDRIRAVGRTGIVLRKYFDGEHIGDTPSGAGILVGQWQVEEALRERLAELGVRVQHGAALASVDQGASGLRAELSDGTGLHAAYLAGCDGGRSTTRRLLGIPLEGSTAEEEAMVLGDVRAPGLSREFWHQWFTTEGGGILLCPMPGTDSFQLQAAPEKDGEGRTLPPSLESFQRLFDRYARVPGIRLADPTWMSSWRVNSRVAARMRRGRAFLAGDAAHVHPIAGGLGMNTGIQDATALARTLAAALAEPAAAEVLDAYEAERLPAARAVVTDTTRRYERVVQAVRTPGRGTEAGMN